MQSRMRVLFTSVALVLAFGCGGGGGGKGASGGGGTGPGGEGNGGGGGGGGAATGPLTAAECAALYDHIVKLAQPEVPPAEWPATQQALEENRAVAVEECQTGHVTREQYDCFMGAAKWDALAACEPAETPPGD